MNIIKTLPKKILELRQEANLTQKQLAETVGMSRPTITAIEQGKRKITVAELIKFSEVLNCSVNDLINEGGKKTTGQKDEKSLRELYDEYKENYKTKNRSNEQISNPLDDYLRGVNPYYYPSTNNEVKYDE